MKITKRQKQILWNIFEHKNITIEKMSDNLDISTKTISKEIKRLNIFFLPYETEINMKDKKGIKIKSIYPQEDLMNITLNNLQLSTEDEIKLTILLTKDELKINQIEETFYISRPTVIKVIKSIEKIYLVSKEVSKVKTNLSLEERINYALEVILNYIDTLNYRVTFKNIIDHLQIEWDDSWYMLDIKEIPNIDKIEYTDESIIKYYIVKNLMTYFNNKTFDILSILKVKKILNVDFNNELTKKIHSVCNKNLKDFLKIEVEELIPLLNHLTSIITQKQLYKQNEVYVYLKYLKEFKDKYPLTINIAKNITSELEKTLEIEIGEYEQYFIALHIQMLFENNEIKKTKKILIICEYGISLSNFIATRLKQKINMGIDIETTSLAKYRMEEAQYANYDLIISTILNFKGKQNEVIHISPFLIEDEIDKINIFLKRLESYNVLKEILTEEDLMFIDKISNVEEVLDLINKKTKPYVKDGYMESLIKRNQKEPIPVNNIIFPHGDPNLVKVSKVFIFILAKPMSWDEKKVQIVIVNCWNQNFVDTNTEFIKYYYRMLVKKKIIEKILNDKTSKAVRNYLLDNIKEKND